MGPPGTRPPGGRPRPAAPARAGNRPPAAPGVRRGPRRGRAGNTSHRPPVLGDGASAGRLVRRLRFTLPHPADGDPAPSRNLGDTLKREIHPEYVETQVSCTCGASFTTRSTIESGTIRAEVCSECHPFYTGKQKILDTGGRVARFEARFGKAAAGSKK
ncbi:hypothetical protein ACE1SV_18890 [Streptomyces sennicomposti]